MADEGNADYTEREMNASASLKEALTRHMNPQRSGTLVPLRVECGWNAIEGRRDTRA
ncbi:MAG: hypothetical protein WCP73_07765 [Eubacteriales bacterium]